MYLESWIKTYLNLTLVVKSQKLYRQHSYTPFQQKLFDLCIKFQKEGMGYKKISQHLNELGFKSIRGKELKQNHIIQNLSTLIKENVSSEGNTSSHSEKEIIATAIFVE